MRLASRHDHLTRALDDWQARGLLPPPVATALRADLGPPPPDVSLARLALTAGVLCLGLGALSLVAANWDAMARGLRLLLVLGGLWLVWGAAAVASLRGWTTRFEALALLATLLFGAAIALVSQIFQIQGDIAGLLFVWAAGGLAGALLARSRMALALAVVLILTWEISGWDRGTLDARDALVLGGLALAAGGALALRARLAAHLALAGLFIWAGAAVLRTGPDPAAVTLVLTLLPGLMALALWSRSGPRHLHGFEVALLCLAALALWLGLLLLFLSDGSWDRILRFGLYDGSPVTPVWQVLALALPGLGLAGVALWRGRLGGASYDLAVAAGAICLVAPVTALPVGVWPRAALALALTVWTVRLGGRHGLTGLRRLGMAGFGVTLGVIYLQTVGSLLGTAGFYAGAGALLIAGAWGWRRWGRA